jgi:broad specificity phosphatase PhoE
LIEWNFEEYEGLMPQQINEVAPGWLTFLDGCPGGETPAPMVERDVALFAHGHVLRVLVLRWIGLDPGARDVVARTGAWVARPPNPMWMHARRAESERPPMRHNLIYCNITNHDAESQ